MSGPRTPRRPPPLPPKVGNVQQTVQRFGQGTTGPLPTQVRQPSTQVPRPLPKTTQQGPRPLPKITPRTQPTPRQIQPKVTQQQPLVPVVQVQDQTLDVRKNELFDAVTAVVESGGNWPRRMKRSTVGWVHSHSSMGIQSRDFWAFTVGAGIVIAVLGSLAFASIGWWALLPAIPLAILTGILFKLASKKWTKHKVVNWLKELDKKIQTPPCLPDPDAELDQGTLAEYVLAVLMVDHLRLQVHIGEKEKQWWQSSHWGRHQYYGEEMGFEKSSELREIGTNLKGILFEGYKKGAQVLGATAKDIKGSESTILRKRKLALLIARERVYIRFIRKYLRVLDAKVQEYVAQVEAENVVRAVNDFTRQVITVGPTDHKHKCSPKCCFGPDSDKDLRFIKLVPTEVQAMGPDRIKRINQFSTQVKTSQGLTRTVTPPNKYRENVDLELDSNLSEDVSEKAFDATVEVALSSLGEALEGVLPSMTAYGAQDLAMSPVGVALSILITEAFESYKTNRPLYRNMKGVREKVAYGKDDLHDAVKKAIKNNNPEMLARALNKVHNHYLDRLKTRTEKFNKLSNEYNIKGKDHPEELTCEDAVKLVRHYFKVYNYAEKARIHMAFIDAGLTAIENSLNKMTGLSSQRSQEQVEQYFRAR